jgi:SAM-dependent methyltransferase
MPSAPPKTHAAKIAQWIGPGKLGAEIGAGGKPVPGLQPPPLQVDCFKSFGADTCTADYYGHACRLPFRDHALDYLVASHVLEHVANPVAALIEWYRVVRPGGIIYLIVPNRRAAWDRTRELTTVEHMLTDFAHDTTALDPTHIDEFAAGVDWSLFDPSTPTDLVPAKRAELARGLHHSVTRGEDINIHFHTFEPSNLRELLESLARAHPETPRLPRLNWEIVDFADGFPAHSPNGVLAVLRVHKGWRARADADALRLRLRHDPRAILLPEAEPFAAWAARTPGLGGVK